MFWYRKQKNEYNVYKKIYAFERNEIKNEWWRIYKRETYN